MNAEYREGSIIIAVEVDSLLLVSVFEAKSDVHVVIVCLFLYLLLLYWNVGSGFWSFLLMRGKQESGSLLNLGRQLYFTLLNFYFYCCFHRLHLRLSNPLRRIYDLLWLIVFLCPFLIKLTKFFSILLHAYNGNVSLDLVLDLC